MQHHNVGGKLVSAALVFAISGLAGVAPAGTGAATLTGKVLAAGSGAPLEGWTVLVGNPRSATIQSTTTTDAKGGFTVPDLPPATYELAVRAKGTLYPATGSIALAPGQARDVLLAVNQQQQAPPPGPPPDDSSGGGSWWNNPAMATLAVVGGAVLIGVLVDQASDDDQAASPSQP